MTKEKTLGPDPPEHGQEDTAAGFFAFNPQTLNITRATATFSRILGHTPENLIPSPLSRIWPDGAEREEFIRLISRQEAARNYPVDLVCHDGTILPVTITAASLSEMEVVCIVSPRHPGLQEEDLQILNSLMDTVLILDWDGTALFANAAAATLVGIPSSDVLIGQSPLQFAHPDYAESIISDLMNVRSGREGYPGYYMMRDLHGNDKLIEGVGTKIIFKGQEANLVALREITGRKGAEDELIRTNQHFRDLYRLVRMMCDNVPDLIWAKNMENQYLFTNKATCEKLLNAADTSEPLGKTGAYFAERERQAHPDDPDWHTFDGICQDSDTIVLECGESMRFYESGNIRGEFFIFDVNKAPFWDDDGRIIGTVGCGRDVTEERQVEERLWRSEALLTQMAQASPIAHFVVDDRTDEILYFNDRFCDIWGLSHLKDDMRRKKVEGSDIISICTPLLSDPEAFTASWTLLQDETNRSVITDEIRLVDGRCIKRFSTQIRDADDRYFGRLHLLEDITEQKRVSEALRRHDDIMSAVNFAADRFLKESDWKAEMDAVLERFGRATGTSAVHVFENSTDPVTGNAICIRRWGWRAEGVDSRIDDPEFQTIPCDTIPRWHDELAAGRPIVGTVREFPESEQSYLNFLRSRSLAIIPILVHKQWWGFIGFDECQRERTWLPAEVDALQAAASIIGSAVLRRMDEEIYRNPVEQSPLGIYLMQDGRLRYFNTRFAEIFGYLRDELRNYDAQSTLIAPECLDDVRKRYRAILSGYTESEHHEFCGKHKDGRVIYLENFATRLQFEGRPAVIGNLVDVTDRKRVNEALRSSEERLKIIFEYAPDAFFLVDMNRTLVDGNQAAERLLGCTRNEFIGKSFTEVVHLLPEDLPKVRAKFGQAMAGDGATPTDLTLIRSDGTRISVEVTAFPVSIDGRHLVLAIGRDVSTRHQLEDLKKKAFIQIEENIEQLAILNDSIRNPLTVIIALAEMDGAGINQKIVEAAWEIDKIIDQLDQGWLISRKVKDFLKKHYS